MKKLAILVCVSSFLVLFSTQELSAISKENPCGERKNIIVLSIKKEKLYLCGAKGLEGTFRVSLGKNGAGKQQQGDNKTPLGIYTIGQTRDSEKFHLFIPIGYPTQEQKKKGFTGGDIGIHGPWQPLSWLGWLNTLLNWTQGCIAVGSNKDIEEISEWVKQNKPKTIYIE